MLKLSQYSIKFFFIAIIISCYCLTIWCQLLTISGNFLQCLLQEPFQYISLDSLCDNDGLLFPTNNQHAESNCVDCDKKLNLPETIVYIKLNYIIEGYGYNCTMQIETFDEFSGIFPAYRFESSIKNVKLSKIDCINMVEADMCKEIKMNCTNKDKCVYVQPMVDKDLKWLRTVTTHRYICSYSKIKIIGKTTESRLFKGAINNCTGKDLECIMNNSIVIWNKDLAHSCIFKEVLYIDDLVQPYTRYNNVFQSKKNRFLFSLTGKIEYCGTRQFFETREGLYLSPVKKDNMQNETIISLKSNAGFKHLHDNDVRKFLLAEEDFDKNRMLATIFSTACSSLTNTLLSHLDESDKFIIISDYELQDSVIYINDGTIYLPVCSNVSTIQVLERTTECYKDFAVKYRVNEKEINGFLRPPNILSQFSEVVDCKTTDKNLVLERSSIKLKRKHQIVHVENYDIQLATKLKIPIFQKGSVNEIFKHHQLLVNSASTIEHIEELIASKEQTDIFFVRGNGNSKIAYVKETNGPMKYLKHAYIWLRNLSDAMWNIIIYTLSALVITFCALIALKYSCKHRR
jgi:hypothetical protein